MKINNGVSAQSALGSLMRSILHLAGFGQAKNVEISLAAPSRVMQVGYKMKTT
jgi:hypothetical protein